MEFLELQAWENKTPLQLRRMISQASSLYHRSTPPVPAKSPLRYKKEVAADRSSSIYEESDSDEGSYKDAQCFHKDSVVDITSPTAAQLHSLEELQHLEDNPDSPRPPSNTDSIESTASTIRFEAPNLHQQDCLCQPCRQIRHQRRKASLKLAERYEACREIVTTIRDPDNPAEYQRGRAYGHWLKMGRLYVKYETLLEVPIANMLEEDILFRHYLRAFRALEELVGSEKIEWGHLFGEQCADRVELESAQLVELSSPKRHKDSITGYISSSTIYKD